MQQRAVNRGVKSNDFILSAPIMGLNTRDALASMQPLYAIRMDNYIPLDNKVALRAGYSAYTMLGKEKLGTKSIFAYNTAQNKKMLAICGKDVYDITSPASVEKLSVQFTSPYCQSVQYKDRLFIMNGIDIPKVYWIDESDVVHFDEWGFTGVTQPQRIISGAVSKNFLWFVEKGSLTAWHTTVGGSVSGELKPFDLAQISKRGGELVAVANWTIDGGAGVDDLTVFLTSEGEALVYSGADPNNIDSWSLKGSYMISKPIGYKCVLPYQGDLVIISEDGYIPLSKSLSLNNSGQSTYAFSNAIRGLVIERTSANKDRFGWEGVIYSKKGYAIFNVPVSQQFEQHVINVNTGAWCRFTGIRAFCWCLFDGNLYFGSDEGVYKYDNSFSDNGVQIEGWIEQAYNNLGSEKLKRVQLLNPRTRSSTGYKLTIYANMDFEERNVGYYSNIGTIGRTKWNSAKWSSTANPIGTKWSTLKATRVRSQWLANSSTGFSASIVFKTKTKGNNIEWFDTGIRYEVGTGIM